MVKILLNADINPAEIYYFIARGGGVSKSVSRVGGHAKNIDSYSL